MSTLHEILLDPTRRPQATRVLTAAVEAEIASKSGLSGAALKTAMKAAAKVSPDLVHRAVDGLLPQFADKLQPYWAAKGDQPFGAHLASRRSEVADDLLAVTDEVAARPKHAAVAKVYSTLRPKAKSQVEEGLPRVGAAIESIA